VTTMNSVVEGLIITVTGVAAASLCALALRSDRYVHQTLESVYRFYRQPVTPDDIRRRSPYIKTALIVGIVMGVGVDVIGIVTLVIGTS